MTPRRAQRPLRLAAAAAAALGLAIAGCGESRKQASSTATTTRASPPATTPAQPRADVAVTETEFSLTPADAHVPKAGQVTIVVRNLGAVRHALEVNGATGEAKTPPIAPGAGAVLTVHLTQPGRYEWYCPIDGHRGRGMRGTIVVGGGSKPKKGATGTGRPKHEKKSEPSGGAGPGPSSGSQGGGYHPG